MSYMHIDNLYKNQDILAFKECYAMEKIHGTSAHVRFRRAGKTDPGPEGVTSLSFFSGGENSERFNSLFDARALLDKFVEVFPGGAVDVTVYGEAYGGKCQGMSKIYGKDLRFVAFEVKIGNNWLVVPAAESVVKNLKLDFVHYERIPTDMDAIDGQLHADSVQAMKNGMGPGLMREGIVLRPLFEVIKNNGARIIAKHKRPEFCETASKREVDPTKRQLLEDADAIAQEWVTRERLDHVLDAIASTPERQIVPWGIVDTGIVIKAMIADVVREAGEEIMDTKESRKAIGTRAAKLYKAHIQEAK